MWGYCIICGPFGPIILYITIKHAPAASTGFLRRSNGIRGLKHEHVLKAIWNHLEKPRTQRDRCIRI